MRVRAAPRIVDSTSHQEIEFPSGWGWFAQPNDEVHRMLAEHREQLSTGPAAHAQLLPASADGTRCRPINS